MNLSFHFSAADIFFPQYLLAFSNSNMAETIATNHVLCLKDFPSYTVSI